MQQRLQRLRRSRCRWGTASGRYRRRRSCPVHTGGTRSPPPVRGQIAVKLRSNMAGTGARVILAVACGLGCKQGEDLAHTLPHPPLSLSHTLFSHTPSPSPAVQGGRRWWSGDDLFLSHTLTHYLTLHSLSLSLAHIHKLSPTCGHRGARRQG